MPARVLAVADAIKAMDYAAYTPQDSVQSVNSFFLVLQMMMGSTGAIALLVAS